MAEYSVVEMAMDDDNFIESNLEEGAVDDRSNCCCTSGVRHNILQFCLDCCGIEENESEGNYIKYSQGLFELVLGVNYCYWFQVIIHNKFCNFLFKCGCTWNQ